MMNEPEIFTLSNGLRAVHLSMPRAAVGYTGIAVRAGSRDELSAPTFGLAHFVEHTIFKGTNKRTSWHILNRMEAVGGELNAYTTKEHTVVYTAFPRKYLGRSLELIADLIVNSRFPKAEIDREREVITDEINSYLDSPADAVFDDFEDILFAGTGYGHNILGTEDSVRMISSDDCRGWLDRYYHPVNMVAFYAGPAGVETFRRQLETYFGQLENRSESRHADQPVIPSPELFETFRPVDTHQAHIVMGTRLGHLNPRDRLTLALLTNLLGGPGMNSLLNVALRERRGLVYTVESALTSWETAAMFTTYFGTDSEDVRKCIRLVNDTISGLAEHPMTGRSLAAVKKQYLGQLVLARENVENRIQGTARVLVGHSPVLSIRETTEIIEAITADDISRMATSISSLSTLGFVPKS